MKFLSTNWLKNKSKAKICLILILLMAAFLRLWGIWRLDLFTYDQARDATYIKRIVVDKKLALIGPQSSVPGISLGPAYYYLMALPLLIFRLDPVGIDLIVALGGVVTVWLLFKWVERRTSLPTAFLISLLYAVSPIVVEMSRRAWNPNLSPFFFILIIYSWDKIVQENKTTFFLLLMFCLGIIIQLHYSALLILPALILSFLIFRKRFAVSIIHLFAGIIIFLFLIFPLVVFNFRHDWLMVKSLFRVIQSLVFSEKLSLLTKLACATTDIWHLYEGLLLIHLRPLSLLIFVFLLVITLVMFIRRKISTDFKIALVFLFTGVIGSQFYPEGFSFFYYVFLFVIPFLIFAYVIEFFFERYPNQKVYVILLTIMLSGWLFYQSEKIVFRLPVRTRQGFQLVADVITSDEGTNRRFNLAAIYKSPGQWENYYRRGIVRDDIRWDHNAVDYGYFVELKGKRPLPWDNFHDAEVLYLIVETRVKEPLKVKFWEIEQFGPKRITSQWKLKNGPTIYKLER